jgi:outer membrane protein TolC
MENAPLVEGEFPGTVDPTLISRTMGHKFVHEALQRRGDHLAAGLSANAEEALLLRARRDLKPRVDLEMSVGYAGYDDRRSNLRPLRSLGGDLSGPSAIGALSFEWPMPNNSARGELLSQRAETEQARLSAIRSANLVSSGVLNSLEALRRAIEQFQFSDQAVQLYEETVVQTNNKMKAGEAPFTELIDVEDRYAEARRARIDTMRRYTIALAQLRLNTGSLSSLADDRAVFQIEDFITVPFAP